MGTGQRNPWFQIRKKKWTSDEKDLLVGQYENMSISIKQLVFDLNRTENSIRTMANKLGLSRKKQQLPSICKVDGCSRKRQARGYCSRHYSEFHRSGVLIVKQKQVSHTGCSVSGCLESHHGKGFCERHYLQVRNCGRVLLPHEEGSHKGKGQCIIRDCIKNRYSNGLCRKHYAQGFKQQAVIYKGGKCQICGYNKHFCALDFHHQDPSEKEANIADLTYSDWEFVKEELDKCILVCANCHRELHFAHSEKDNNGLQ